jgi:hypothetical protein
MNTAVGEVLLVGVFKANSSIVLDWKVEIKLKNEFNGGGKVSPKKGQKDRPEQRTTE